MLLTQLALVCVGVVMSAVIVMAILVWAWDRAKDSRKGLA